MACCPIRPRELILQSTWAHAPKPWFQSSIGHADEWRLSTDGDKEKSTYNFMPAPETFCDLQHTIIFKQYLTSPANTLVGCFCSVPLTPVSGSGLRVVEFEASAYNPLSHLSPKNQHDQKNHCVGSGDAGAGYRHWDRTTNEQSSQTQRTSKFANLGVILHVAVQHDVYTTVYVCMGKCIRI